MCQKLIAALHFQKILQFFDIINIVQSENFGWAKSSGLRYIE